MSKMTKVKQTERDEVIASLREMLPHGSTVYTNLRHVSRSGMQRSISVHIVNQDGEISDVSWRVVKALDWSWDDRRHAVKVSGCGMDMGFHLVHSLSYVLHGRENHGGEGKTRSGYTLTQAWL